MSEENKRITRCMLKELFDKEKLDAADELIHPELVSHEVPRVTPRPSAPARANRQVGDGVNQTSFELIPIGWVESPLTDRASAPKQGHEGSPEAWLVFEPWVLQGLEGVRAGDEVIVLTWLDRARRDVLRVHPRGDIANPEQGVFSTRSPDRPNPIGLHHVKVVSIDGHRFRVRNLEALHDTPIVDVKPVLNTS